MVLAEQRPALVCQRCGRAFASPGGLGSHETAHERADAAEPRPGWRIEAGAGGGWAWALRWRWTPDGGNLDGVPRQLVADLHERLYRARIDPADPRSVLVAAVALLRCRGITVEAVERLPAPPGPEVTPPPPPVIRPRARPPRKPRPPAAPPAPPPAPAVAACDCSTCALWPWWHSGGRALEVGHSRQSPR